MRRSGATSIDDNAADGNLGKRNICLIRVDCTSIVNYSIKEHNTDEGFTVNEETGA